MSEAEMATFEAVQTDQRFQEINERRIALIIKEVRTPLQAEEAAELRSLQEAVRSYLDEKFPRQWSTLGDDMPLAAAKEIGG